MDDKVITPCSFLSPSRFCEEEWPNEPFLKAKSNTIKTIVNSEKYVTRDQNKSFPA